MIIFAFSRYRDAFFGNSTKYINLLFVIIVNQWFFVSNPHIFDESGIFILDTDQSDLKNFENTPKNLSPDFLLVYGSDVRFSLFVVACDILTPQSLKSSSNARFLFRIFYIKYLCIVWFLNRFILFQKHV